LMGFKPFFPDAVVDHHLANRRGESAGQGGDAAAAGRGLFGGGAVEEILRWCCVGRKSQLL